MKISLARKTEKVELELENGEVVVYEIREMTGAEGGAYKNALRAKIRTQGENVEVLDFRGMYSDLLARCMFAPNGQPVAADTINEWPESAVTALFELAQKVNGLAKGEDLEKKD